MKRIATVFVGGALASIATPVEVSGEIEAAIEGRGHPFPDDFAVTLDVTPLGEISE